MKIKISAEVDYSGSTLHNNRAPESVVVMVGFDDIARIPIPDEVKTTNRGGYFGEDYLIMATLLPYLTRIFDPLN